MILILGLGVLAILFFFVPLFPIRPKKKVHDSRHKEWAGFIQLRNTHDVIFPLGPSSTWHHWMRPCSGNLGRGRNHLFPEADFKTRTSWITLGFLLPPPPMRDYEITLNPHKTSACRLGCSRPVPLRTYSIIQRLQVDQYNRPLWIWCCPKDSPSSQDLFQCPLQWSLIGDPPEIWRRCCVTCVCLQVPLQHKCCTTSPVGPCPADIVLFWIGGQGTSWGPNPSKHQLSMDIG